ncbi:MAG: permease [Spirochaetia bacterium]|jgi:uncharacterized membrane protein YraQ (UPF0718 family)|nr:permease [Spirochaetia bacterium]
MKKIALITTVVFYVLFILFSLIAGFEPGIRSSENFRDFLLDMARIVPCAFILIGLFEVWVKKETVEKHMGEKSLITGYIWAVLLAGTTVGGMYVAFPVAYVLYSKGARLSVIFTYIGAAAVCRIPMMIFEASFLGIKFTLIRLAVSLPLVILTSLVLEAYLKNRGYTIKKGR